jgi:tRNA threonylcarbamoyladenosine biosynthesis protein TsaB
VPPTLLAIDTATEVCSVALASDGRISEAVETVGQKHSERVLPMLRQLLQAGGRTLADCDAIAFGAGPGAFTGLRVACGIAQGLAFGAARPVIPVGNLAALAWVAGNSASAGRRILVAIDARMQEVYWALYRVDGPAPEEICPPALAASGELESICRGLRPDLVAGNALLALPGLAARLDCPAAPDARASAAAIAAIGCARHGQGAVLPPEQAAPLYVRDRVALTIEERRSAAPERR